MGNIHNRNMAKFSNSLLYAGIRYLLCRCRNFSLTFFFFKTFEAIASPLKLESSWQRMRNTVPYCLIEWAAKDILIYLKHLVFEKRLDLVLSSPKWSDSLLSINHWHSNENSLFKIFSIFEHLHLVRKYKCHLHTNLSQLLIMIGEDYLQIIEKEVVEE